MDLMVSTRVAQMWFKRFKSGNFCVKDEVRSGRLITDKISAIFEKVEQDRHINSYDVAEGLVIIKQFYVIYKSLGTRKNLTFEYHMIALRET